MWRYFGPAFVASVAYIDPGIFAPNIEGGAEFGYSPDSLVVGTISRLEEGRKGVASFIQMAAAVSVACAHFISTTRWSSWGPTATATH